MARDHRAVSNPRLDKHANGVAARLNHPLVERQAFRGVPVARLERGHLKNAFGARLRI
jgi:hypothetical protein